MRGRSDASNNDKMISLLIHQYMLASPDTFDPAVHSYNYLGGLGSTISSLTAQTAPDSLTTIPVFLSALWGDNALYLIRLGVPASRPRAREFVYSRVSDIVTDHKYPGPDSHCGLTSSR